MTRILVTLVLISCLSGCADTSSDYRQAMLHLHQNHIEEAWRLLQALAANGHAPARYHLALLQWQQAGKWDDTSLAMLHQAALADHLGARHQLALIQREDGAIANAEQGFKSLAEEGFVPARFELARLLEDRGDPSAAEQFRHAAEAGHEGAVKRLALAYELGELGLAKDARLAAAWRERLVVKKF